MRTLVLPALGKLTLREIGVARCDHFLKQLARQSYSRAKHARVVLRLALSLAVRHEVLLRNPMDHVSRLHRPSSTLDALTNVEVTAIRAAIALWEAGRAVSGPKPDGQLGAIVEVMPASHVRADRRGAGDPSPRRRHHEFGAVRSHRWHDRQQ